MPVRAPAVAGRFYPGSPDDCRAEIAEYVSQAESFRAGEGASLGEAIGGIVPHAGWVFSGAVAAEVIHVLASDPGVETFVIFGAVHRFSGPSASAYTSGTWQTPLGEVGIDEELAAAVVRAPSPIRDDADTHRFEHSIEVQVPLVQYLAPSARLLPVMVPPAASAHEVGGVVAEQARAIGRRVVFLGSTDLTHYGPGYQFTPMGAGSRGLEWAKEVNDRRLLDRIVAMEADKIVGEAAEHHNACGSGAVAAAIRACQICGADTARLLRHTTSNEVSRGRYGGTGDAVGYAGVIFSRQAGSTE